MTILCLEALVVSAASLPVLMAGAWVVQQRTGNSGWVDAIRTFSPGLAGPGALCGRSKLSRPTPGIIPARRAALAQSGAGFRKKVVLNKGVVA
jgi:hypothetical protein